MCVTFLSLLTQFVQCNVSISGTVLSVVLPSEMGGMFPYSKDALWIQCSAVGALEQKASERTMEVGMQAARGHGDPSWGDSLVFEFHMEDFSRSVFILLSE